MAAIALNLLALLIVLGMCWGSMMWLSGRFHAHGSATTVEVDGIGDLSTPVEHAESCAACEGFGATNKDGRLSPCSECYGTGVLA